MEAECVHEAQDRRNSVGNKETQANRRVVGLLETKVLKLADFLCFHAIVEP